MAPTDKTWTESLIADLRRLWGEGHSTAEIGRRMGVSKNAVVGKAHRLGLPPRPSPIRWGGGTDRGPEPPPPLAALPSFGGAVGGGIAGGAANPASPPRGTPAPPAPGPAARCAEAAAPRCCWPLGDPGQPGFRFCDAGADAGRPYCPRHGALAYVEKPRAERHAT